MTTAGQTTTYAWDYESRLTSISKPGTTTNAFAYNGLDTRVAKTDSTGSFTYRRDGAYVTDPVLADGAATYTPGISERRGGTSRYLHSGLKNADSRTVVNNAVEATRVYDAFGNVDSFTGTWNGPFGAAGGFGYHEDPDHGLKLLGHRYYDSTTGRFISRDASEAGRNWYAYCYSSPIFMRDPQGLSPEWWSYLGEGEVWSKGLTVAGDALLSNASLGFYDGGASQDEPGFRESQACWTIAELALTGAVGLAKSSTRAATKEGVYIVRTKTGQKYVGQSCDIDRRLSEHVRDGLISPQQARKAKRIRVEGGKRQREIREVKELRKRGFRKGGVRSLKNRRWPIAESRWQQCDII